MSLYAGLSPVDALMKWATIRQKAKNNLPLTTEEQNDLTGGMTFSPGQTGETVRPLGSIAVETFYVSGIYHDYTSYSPNYDWGVAILKSDVGPGAGYFGFKTTGYFGKQQTELAGFPGDSSRFITGMTAGEMWTDKCTASNPMFGTVAEHTCDMLPGDSGAPLWDPTNHITHINSGEETGGKTNYGVQITDSMFDQFMTYRKRHG